MTIEFIKTEFGEAGELADALYAAIADNSMIYVYNKAGQELKGFDLIEEALSDGSKVKKIVLRFK